MDVRSDGMAAGEARPLRVYGSAETHTWIQKAADLFGLGTGAIRWVETDREQRLRVPALRELIAEDRAAGAVPLFVIGTAGSVSTGAVDPLDEIAEVCRDEEIWFHVDGAYGAPAAALPDARPRSGPWRWPTRSRSTRTSGSTRRSKRGARSSGTLGRSSTRSPTGLPTTPCPRARTHRSATSTTGRRTRAASARSRSGSGCARPVAKATSG